MEVLYPRCAGLDVHAATVVACVRSASGRAVTYEHRTVATTTSGLLELADWLTALGVTHVAMEATGVYWKPVWHVLEAQVELLLANVQHARSVPRPQERREGRAVARGFARGRPDPRKLSPARPRFRRCAI